MIRRHLILPTLAFALLGCGGARDQRPDTVPGSFNMIEGAVNDIVSRLNDPNYKSTSRDLGTDSDNIGMALISFKKQTEGTELAAKADEIASRLAALEKLVASRAPIDQQRAAAKSLKEAVDAVRSQM